METQIIPEDDKMIGEFTGEEIYKKFNRKIIEKRLHPLNNRIFISGLLNNKYLLQYIDKNKKEIYLFANDEAIQVYCFTFNSNDNKKYKLHCAIGHAIDLIHVYKQLNINLPIGE